ncbi:hypothetical protein ABVK25_009332 [Lepraria finkii]|uniref:Uncharacterized protein n=1 Tax=Lepraria finkii TaxID=1340010 RepID=A0ABR4AXH7_9LECA
MMLLPTSLNATKNGYGHRPPPSRLIRRNPYVALTVGFVDFQSSSKLATFPFLSAYCSLLQHRSVQLSRSPSPHVPTSLLWNCEPVGEKRGGTFGCVTAEILSASLEGTIP